jgi:hypothetical protein
MWIRTKAYLVGSLYVGAGILGTALLIGAARMIAEKVKS